MSESKTRQYRFLPRTIERLDRCINYRGETRDQVLNRILDLWESKHGVRNVG